MFARPSPRASRSTPVTSRMLRRLIVLAGAVSVVAAAVYWTQHNRRTTAEQESRRSSVEPHLPHELGNSERPAAAAAVPPAATVDSPPTGATVEASEPLPTVPGLGDQRFDAVVRSVAEREDPAIDGWDSEQFSEQADEQFQLLGKMLADPELLDEDHLGQVAAATFSSPGLRPASLATVYADASLSVARGAVVSGGMPRQPALTGAAAPYEGLVGVRRLIHDQLEPFADLAGVRSKFKIVRVDQQGHQTDTVAYFQMTGHGGGRTIQINSTWNCRWQQDSAVNSPKLIQVTVDDYEEVSYHGSEPGPMFADCTQSLFRNSDRFSRQLIYGIDHWTNRFDGAIARPAAGHGIAVDDVNGDGRDDVYLCQSPGLPNLLLLQNPDGTVRDTAVEAGVNWLEGTRAGLFADLDNDGDPDLVSVLGSKVVVQANDGTGKFQLVTVVSTPSSLFAINAVDYDGDRDLDLYIAGYTLSAGVDLNDVFANPMPFHDANNGAPNVMLRNEGAWNFSDVTNEVGLGQNNSRFSYASAWEDYDNDGDLDLYVANDFGRNNLYRNEGGRFVDVAAELDVEDIGPGMSAAWGDFNNDGHPDFYVSNMFSSAGNRITHQPQFKSQLASEEKRIFQRHARGNSLFENLGNGQFRDRSVDLGVTLGRWAWGSLFVDINNDGWEDLYVTNGFLTAAGGGHDL